MLKERDLKIRRDKKLKTRGVIDQTPKVGDVVLLLDDDGHIGNGKLSRIMEIKVSKEKLIQSVKILHGPNKNPTWWPIQKNSFLEIADPKSLPGKSSKNENYEKIPVPIRKSKRLLERKEDK